MTKRRLYIFLDEGGNLDFSTGGTKYFMLTSIAQERPFEMLTELADYRYDCIEYGHDQQFFHAADDNKFIRGKVFEIIKNHLNSIRIDSLIVEKAKTGPALQEVTRFYPEMLGHLLKYVVRGVWNDDMDEIFVITDQIPLNKKRKAIEKAIKETLSDMLPRQAKYRVLHHSSKSHAMLQVADYCNWAIFRNWERGDDEHYKTIRRAIESEFNIFRTGTAFWY